MTVVSQARLRNLRASSAIVLVVFLALFQTAQAQLRIVTYNTATGNVAPGVQTARAGADIILKSIGEETINGIARPIDVLLLQEQFSTDVGDDQFDDVATQSFVDLMNTIYGTPQVPTPYARGYIDAATSTLNGDAGGPGIVYNTQTIELVEELRFGEVSGTEQARSTLRYQLRPVGYDSNANFYVYNSHYKSGSSSDDQDRRNIEATSIRTDPMFGSDLLGPGAHALFVGDYNMSSSNEDAFQTLISLGEGQASDPLNRLGSWGSNATFAEIHTQAPCLSNCGGLTTGGMDDRYDFQLMTGEFLDGVGYSYIGPTVPGMSGTTHSYRAFGNGGNTFNQSINNRNESNQITNIYPFNGVTSYTAEQILDALATVSDHLPVVADFQLPDAPSNPELVAAKWTFEASQPAATNEATISNIAAEIGTGTARGMHAAVGTDYSSPGGNGSPHSFSSNNWGIGDFYEFSIGTEGFQDLRITFDQTSSNTGPRDFRLEYSADGTNFLTTDLPAAGAYTVLANNSPNPSWSDNSPLSLFSFELDLTDIEMLDDQADVYFRLTMVGNTQADGVGTVAAGGTSRVDNLTIYYYAIPGLDGDFNADGFVDAADYVMWRKDNSVGAYADWVANFGASLPGAGGDDFGGGSVPEPGAWLLVTLGTCLLAARRGKLAGWTPQR
jgi:hypothetical protein